MARVFSLKHSSTVVDNMGIYSVDTESVYQIVQTGRNKIFRGCLAGKPYPQATRETQLSPFVLIFCIPVMCKAHASFRGMLSRKLLAKTLLSSIG